MTFYERVGGFGLGLPYRREHGPDSIGQRDVETEGLNCQAFVHLFYSNVLGIFLDPSMRSEEIFKDERTFETVREGQLPAVADIYCMGSERTRPKGLHLAVVVGFHGGFPLLRHANKKDGQVRDITLDELRERYGLVHAVKRLKSS